MTKPNQLFFTIPVVWAGRTLESFLRHELHLSRGQIRTLKRSSGVLLNSEPVRVIQQLQGGESLTLIIHPIKQRMIPEKIPLHIIYEDSDLVIINKPAGMAVHPVGVYQSGTLANALLYHWQFNQESASFHPVHRLDRLTSGLIVIAKNPWVHQQLARQIDNNQFHRLYLAITEGIPGKNSARIIAPLKLAGKGFKWEVADEGKPAITRFRILDKNPAACLLAIKIFTGRTHQIRAHLANLGTPLLGDSMYGSTVLTFTRPALHAIRISFIHPRFQQKFLLSANLPNDFNQILTDYDLALISKN